MHGESDFGSHYTTKGVNKSQWQFRSTRVATVLNILRLKTLRFKMEHASSSSKSSTVRC